MSVYVVGLNRLFWRRLYGRVVPPRSMDLWAGDAFPARGICIVTHDIEEAVLLADRVIVLGANPGQIRAEVAVPHARPRDRRSPAFGHLVDQLYGLLTGRETEAAAPGPATPTAQQLPAASVGGLAGLFDYDTDSDKITADPAAGIHPRRPSTVGAKC